ncbi:beta-ketoacyl synthase N-terminal-like domain-containing protein [Nocardia wallacei]|uniref:beta-ketoacyl synthase N-terminal-like domain-containing protein n=1 Tax=Nocardia wallacei TaxID=480035 RepID=UPI0024575822|nr:beta-ketoacyl synthase N-terminal-like domain-containing protein [Nocardia wallacei]
MALAVARSLADRHGSLWDEIRARTGVITGHTGPTRSMAEYTIRVGADDLREALATTPASTAADTARLEETLTALAARLPVTNEAAMTGQLGNVISSVVVNRHRLHGLAMNIDCGRSSTRAALHVAERYLRSGDLDLALVIGLNGHATPLMAHLCTAVGGELELAEGAVAFALTRESEAARHGWPILARIRTSTIDDEPCPSARGIDGRTYLGADGALAVLPALTGGGTTDTIVLDNPDPAPRVEIQPTRTTAGQPTPAPARARAAVTAGIAQPPTASEMPESEPDAGRRPGRPASSLPDRSVVVLRRADPGGEAGPGTRIDAATSILTHTAALAHQLEPLARTANARILCTDPDTAASPVITVANDTGPDRAVATAAAAMPVALEHVLIVASVRHPHAPWPAPPPRGLVAMQECALAATAAVREGPHPDGSTCALLLDPLRRHLIHPRARPRPHPTSASDF